MACLKRDAVAEDVLASLPISDSLLKVIAAVACPVPFILASFILVQST